MEGAAVSHLTLPAEGRSWRKHRRILGRTEENLIMIGRRRSAGGRTALLLLLLIPAELPGQAAGGMGRDRSSPGPAPVGNRLVWRGDSPPGLERIAALLAPVLWFSADEPLILRGQLPLPHPHPCDAPADRGIVYYQVARIRLRSDRRIGPPPWEGEELFANVHGMALRYFFYYRQDFGFHPHLHDLELVEMEVSLDRPQDGAYTVRLERIIGFAHGTDWYANELVVDDDIRLPPVILVEEGKHASCPDRNADGLYTPGYDVNRRVHDAWGVRDVLGSGFLLASGFQSSMMKPRQPRFRVFPPETPGRPPEPASSLQVTSEGVLGNYELRASERIGTCAEMNPEGEFLLRAMKEHGFGAGRAPEQYRYEILKELREPLSGTHGLLPSIGFRWDRKPGLSFTLRGFDLREVYAVPKINWFGSDFSVEAMLTRSAAQFFTWYASAGLAREMLPVARDSRYESRQWTPASELGIKLRTRITGKRRLFALGYGFAGLRVGLRFSGFNEVRRTRLAVEVGPGVW